jgi:Ca-activated chloride channel family protein
MRRAALTIVFVVFTLPVLGAVPGTLDAAPSTGEIHVRVLDEDRVGFPGAMVTLTRRDGPLVPTNAVTDAGGFVSFPAVPPGDAYVVSAFVAGYAHVSVPDVRVASGKVTEIPIVLIPVFDLTEHVEVTVVRSEEVVGHSQEFVRGLPVQDRFYRTVLTLAPGVQGGDGTPQPRGTLEREFRATVSGVVGGVVGGAPGGIFEESERSTESYRRHDDPGFRDVATDPLSTFSIDVDTASYANVRRFLEGGSLPPKDAVRIEEMLNYFPYDLPAPRGADPFAVWTDVGTAPWAPEHRLMRVALKAREIDAADRPAANLVFLVDVSGSMRPEHKLPLLKRSLRMLLESLEPRDRVALVVYAGSSGLVLDSTPVTSAGAIAEALDRLEAGGSTNGGEGIVLAYEVARANFVPGGINRVILATDGDFNVGVSSEGDLTRLVETEARSGTFLTVLGFGMGNYKDSTLEALADRGNGNYAYIDSLLEARKALVEQAGGTLVTVAKDVKIQIEFNPVEVASYRLLGYENRLLATRDFDDDAKDAGEMGSGHVVTALYEIVPAGKAAGPQPLEYQMPASTDAAKSGAMATVKVRFKEPDGETSRLSSYTVRTDQGVAPERAADFDFASAVACFGMLLRESEHRGDASWAMVRDLATRGLSWDPGGWRAQFLALAGKAERMN